MSIPPSDAIQNACRHLLRPVVSFLLRAGLTWKAFSEIAREVYVDVAGREYGLDGRLTNVSRVAILTGLSRRQVREQRAALENRRGDSDSDFDSESDAFRMNPATRVITGWHQDPEFSRDGKPRVLAREGKASFTELLKRYAGDIPHVAMEKELKRVGAIEERGTGELRATSRVFMPAGLDVDYVRMFGAHLHDLAGTIAHNARTGEGATPRFQRVVSNERIPDEHAREFEALVNMEGQALLERLDAWLAERELKGGDASRGQRVGAGIYLFQDDATD